MQFRKTRKYKRSKTFRKNRGNKNDNMTKTEFMLIGSRQRLSTVTVSPTLAINDFRVTQVATAKSLAVIIDDNLDCGSHMEKIIKNVSSGIGAIKRVRHLVPQATLQLIYQALIHPHFNYCNTVTLSPKRPYN